MSEHLIDKKEVADVLTPAIQDMRLAHAIFQAQAFSSYESSLKSALMNFHLFQDALYVPDFCHWLNTTADIMGATGFLFAKPAAANKKVADLLPKDTLYDNKPPFSAFGKHLNDPDITCGKFGEILKEDAKALRDFRTKILPTPCISIVPSNPLPSNKL